MSTLEVLLEAERTLMDEDQHYDHRNWNSCTCGHIYHAITGIYSSMAGAKVGGDYQRVLVDVVKALDLEDKVKGLEEPFTISDVVSDYVEIVALGHRTHSSEEYDMVEREHALKVIREAIAAIRKQDDEAMLKVIDSHTYGIST